MYKYKTIAVSNSEDLKYLNTFYDDGWEFINSVAPFTTSGFTGYVYFTIRKQTT